MDALLQHAQQLAEQPDTPYLPVKHRIAYIVSHGQSYASNGYAIRTQGIAQALNQHGFETFCFVRPGRPWELGIDQQGIAPEVTVQGVRYIHSRWPNGQRPEGERKRIEASVDRFIELFRVYRPQVVLAASNHEVALPALIAARRLGLPFHYEVRGFWEISRISRDPSWHDTPDFMRHYDHETWVCNHADRLYTLNRFMREELVRRGVAAQRVTLVPNSVAELPSSQLSANQQLKASLGIPEGAFVVGYIGALTEYEGLELLLEALVKPQCQTVHALIVGGYSPVSQPSQSRSEPIVEQLASLAKRLGVADRVTFTGRVPHEALGDYFGLIDATVIPRRPLPVCELVSAIKPLEYLAWGKPVIASDVAPQAELLEHGELGWLFAKGNIDSLADTIQTVRSGSPEVRQAKVDKGRETIKRHYLWHQVVRPMVEGLKGEPLATKGPRVACIMDNFTYSSYSPEANFFQLTPEYWEQELEGFRPEMLFIESAWRGKDELWGSKVGHKSQEVLGIVSWCNQHGIPTVFWNKEDPVHFETFLNTAKLFDHVFTTDLDCIHRYKAALGHNQVYFLPFACQPRLTNPIETYDRKDAFCFAGAYYVRYPDRTKDLETFVEELPKFKPLEIYDRNYGKNDPNYQFPANYQPYIVGTLPFSEIDKAYKGYRYAINLNSIKQSQTMFARRVYELLGSNTITVSNFSRGVRLMFGELVLTSDSGEEIVDRLQKLEENPAKADKFRLAGLRKVLREHTYQNRLDYILSKVTGKPHNHPLPGYTVISPVADEQQLKNTLDNFKRQSHEDKKLLLVLCDGYSEAEAKEHISVEALSDCCSCIAEVQLDNQQLKNIAGGYRWAASFSPEDYYGPNYLTDLALATRFTDAPVIGKASYYQVQEGELRQQSKHHVYASGAPIPVRASAQAPEAQNVPASKWLNSIITGWHTDTNQQSIDPFNYAWHALVPTEPVINLEQLQLEVGDAQFDEGIPLDDLTQLAERTIPTGATEDQIPTYSAEELYQIFDNPGTNNVQLKVTDDGIVVTSDLEDGKHEYIYVKGGNDLPLYKLQDPATEGGRLRLHLEMTPGLNLSFVIIFFEAKGERLQHKILQANKNNELVVPEGTAKVRLGFRVYQTGQGTIKKLLLGNKDLSPGNVLGRSDVLLVTNHYPSYDDLYRNGFVHSRVKAYKERGVEVDVFRFRKDQAVSWHEFQNVDVITGSPSALSRILESGKYRHVLVHFLDAEMWDVLGGFIDEIKMTVWVHGAEVQPWWRREYNYTNKKDLELAKIQSAKRLGFWQKLLDTMPTHLSLVFVSQYFADEVMEDIGFRLPENQYKIIHNPVDTDLFFYIEKTPEQRKRILSIRPYASRKYANDLSVNAVLELSKEPFFNDLEFRFIGDGALFDETLLPLRKFSNVTIERGFLAQTDIAKLHKEYGVFLCPTRMDAQGVSKDEAMSSGLVVVTNGVTAIPEFLDNNCGVLAEGEDFLGIADGIKRLYLSEAYFKKLSIDSSKRARKQVGKELIIKKELKEFEGLKFE
ncbi:glycosyltransferase [Nitrincola sp. MINF-07-Sa-05]|uniref:glycosyltransferase n=1 Tax=Nitrincola salilacus TaxID=3400273 RepID=UPI00391810A0